MFSWFGKKRPAPTPALPVKRPSQPIAQPPAKDKPFEGISGQIAFASGGRSWTEEFDVVTSLAKVLDTHGLFTTRRENTLLLDPSGYVLNPVLTFFKPTDKGGSQTTTIIRIKHPTLIPDGLFEFQHSFGDSVNDALTKGFAQWAQTDLVTLIDALEVKPSKCLLMAMTLPAKDGQPARRRRIILGPVTHMSLKKADPHAPQDEHPPFCACCLLTNSFEPFKPFVESDRVLGIRLFAMRDKDGLPSADCRINGEEFEPGKVALKKYVEKWPQNGVEFRKQYILIRPALPGEADQP